MLTENKIWEKVRALQGETIYTVTNLAPNHIILVEDTGNSNDSIIIENRKSRPTREDIIRAYDILYQRRELERKRDLDWLVSKRVSSIVFKIISMIAEDEINIKKNRFVVLRLKEAT